MSTEKEALRREMSSRFRATRKRLDLTQEKMAELLGIDLRSYCDLEHGKYFCSTLVFLRYLLISSTNINELLAELEKNLTAD